MHPAFKTIELGPFHTAYHREAIDDGFCEALSAFLERDLLPQVDEPFSHTEGHLTAEFDEDKYCGPQSAVRDAYRLKFSFIRPNGADEIEARIYRDPKSGSFRSRFERQPLILWTERRKAEQRTFGQAVDRIVERIRANEQSEWTCPRCSAALSLVNAPELFDLRCKNGCFNFNFHRDPKTSEFRHGHFFSRPPD